MESSRRICGGVRRIVVTEEQRYGPRWLRVNDDDEVCAPYLKVYPSLHPHSKILEPPLNVRAAYYLLSGRFALECFFVFRS